MYKNATYIKPLLIKEPTAIRVDINGVASFVPLDPANTDYQRIMALVEDGKLTIAPAEEPTE